MNFQIETNENLCRQNDIAAYIDGELSSGEELKLELHFANCVSCRNELNEQKNFLRALDVCLEKEKELELPENFTKIVIANAESKVSGLRQPKERFNALFVCAALFLLTLLGLGGETGAVLNAFFKFGEQILTVGGFVWHLIYDVAIGTAVILRSLSYQFVYGSAASFAFVFVAFAVSLLVLSKLIARLERA